MWKTRNTILDLLFGLYIIPENCGFIVLTSDHLLSRENLKVLHDRKAVLFLWQLFLLTSFQTPWKSPLVLSNKMLFTTSQGRLKAWTTTQMSTLLPLCTHSCLFSLQKSVKKICRCLDSEIRWFLSAGMSFIWCNVLHLAGEVFLSAVCHLQQSPLSLTSDPSFPLTGVDNLFVAEILIAWGKKIHWEWMQCFIDRLAVPVKCFYFWWMIVKESNAVITGKDFLVPLSFCSNFCCSLCQGQLQREALHQLGWCPGLRMAQTKDSAGHKGQAGRGWAQGPVTGTVPGSAALAPEV